MVDVTVGRRDYYVYVIFRPNGIPCYVGKGKRQRWNLHEWYGASHYNKRLGRIITKAGGALPKIKVREDLTNKEACETEIALIAAIGRGNSGPLVNLTDGGDGVPGHKHSAETRALLSKASKGIKRSAATRAKMREVQALRKAEGAYPKWGNHSEETKAKISAAHTGKTGHKHTEAARAKMRAAQTGRKASEETRAKLRITSRNNVTAAGRARIAEFARARKGTTDPVEVRAKKKDAQLCRRKRERDAKAGPWLIDPGPECHARLAEAQEKAWESRTTVPEQMSLTV